MTLVDDEFARACDAARAAFDGAMLRKNTAATANLVAWLRSDKPLGTGERDALADLLDGLTHPEVKRGQQPLPARIEQDRRRMIRALNRIVEWQMTKEAGVARDTRRRAREPKTREQVTRDWAEKAAGNRLAHGLGAERIVRALGEAQQQQREWQYLDWLNIRAGSRGTFGARVAALLEKARRRH